MKGYDPSNPKVLIGKGGLFSSLKKALIERALNSEMDFHLGYSKNVVRKGVSIIFADRFPRDF